MNKTLLFIAMIVLGVTQVSSQSVKIGTHNKGNAKTKVVEISLTNTSTIVKSVPDNKAQVLRNKLILNKKSTAKRMVLQQKIARKHTQRISTFKSRTPLMNQKASTDTTLYEGFESYNGTAKDWIPASWTELNKTANMYVTNDSVNSTWSVNAENGYAAPTYGTSMAWIDWDENYNPQDEWLVSPAFTPVSGDIISFDFFYNPFWMYYDWDKSTDVLDVFKYTAPNATMEMYVSTDNGANWIKVWDAIDDVSQFNDTNIAYFSGVSGMWNTIKKSLDAYIGKSIKLAFRYVGTDGDSMGLDNISVRQLSPYALYARPQGYFYAGLTPTYDGIDGDLMIGHAYQDATWNNYSNDESNSFLWTFEDPTNDAATINSTDIDPTVFYPAGGYKIPLLTATVGSINSTYSWGASPTTSFFQAGGNTSYSFGTLGMGNYDLTAQFQNPFFGANDYCFGTGPGGEVDAIANYFDKPVHKYLLDSVWVNLGQFAAPAGTEFKMIIHRVLADGSLADTIATSVCLAQDVTEPETGYFTMPFKGFTSLDPITGLDVTFDFLEISDAILIELTGFNVPNVTLAAFSQVIDSSDGESNAYVFYNNTNGNRSLLGGSDYIGATSLLFNLGATYSYIASTENEFVAPIEGGNKTFSIDTWSSPSDWWSEVELPTWITADTTFNETTWATTVTLTATALPAQMAGRGATITLTTYGAEFNIYVKQGVYAGLKDNKVAQNKVISNENSFELTYTSDFNTVALYNVAGQVIANYNLPISGKLSIPNNQLNKGIYIFKFAGKTTEIAKVIR